MKILTRLALSLAIAAPLAIGGTVAAELAAAPRADAVTKTGCYPSHTTSYQPITWCYYNYNWFEESWMGGRLRDGWYYEYRSITA